MDGAPAIQVVPLSVPHSGAALLPRGDDWVQWLREHGLYEAFIESLGGWMAAHPIYLPQPLTQPAAPPARLATPQSMRWDGFRLHDVPHELHDRALMLIGSLDRPHPSTWQPLSPPPFQMLPARWVERAPEKGLSQGAEKGSLSTASRGAGPTDTADRPGRLGPPPIQGPLFVSPVEMPHGSTQEGVGASAQPAVLIMPPVPAPDWRAAKPPVEDDPLRPWRVLPIPRDRSQGRRHRRGPGGGSPER